MDRNAKRLPRQRVRLELRTRRLHRTGEDVQPFYAMADVFVLSSHSEGSPNVCWKRWRLVCRSWRPASAVCPRWLVKKERCSYRRPCRPGGRYNLSPERFQFGLRLVEGAAAVLTKNHTPEQYLTRSSRFMTRPFATAPKPRTEVSGHRISISSSSRSSHVLTGGLSTAALDHQTHGDGVASRAGRCRCRFRRRRLRKRDE